MTARPALFSPARGRLVAASSAALALGLGLLLFLSTGQDDAYIAFWPAYTLLEHGAMLNYSGMQVEQSSSLLYTLALAAVAGAVGLSVPAAGYWIGVACGVIAVLRCQGLCERLGWGRPAWLPLALGTLPIYLYWWFGGLETSLVAWLGVEAAIVAADLIAARRRVASAQTLGVTAGFAMVRPEAAIVLSCAIFAWLALDVWDRRRAGRARPPVTSIPLCRWLALVLACQALLMAFRMVLFGQLFPQPVAAKIGGSPIEQLALGLSYYAKCAVFRPYAVTFFASLLAALGWMTMRVARRDHPDAGLFLLLFVAAHAAMVATSGGDWMRGARFFAQFAPITLVAAAGVLHALRSRPRWLRAVLAFAALCNAGGIAALAFGEATGRPLWTFVSRDPLLRQYAPDLHWSERANRVRTRDLLFLHHLLPRIDAMLEQRSSLTILSPQAGMVAYYVAHRHFGRIRFVDLHGLTSREATRIAESIGAARGPTGVQASFTELVTGLEREGGTGARPDLIFDIVASDGPLLGLGYAPWFRQVGFEFGPSLQWGPLRPPQVAVSVYQYAAVDQHRWPGIASEPFTFDWSRAGVER